MRVFKQNSAHPFRDWKQKHVVAERGRPIRHGEPDVFAGDHPAAANEQERGETSEPRETIEPRHRSPHTWRIRRMARMRQMQLTNRGSAKAEEMGRSAHLATAKALHLGRHQRAPRALSATPDNPAAYPPRACLSFRNGLGRKAGRK